MPVPAELSTLARFVGQMFDYVLSNTFESATPGPLRAILKRVSTDDARSSH